MNDAPLTQTKQDFVLICECYTSEWRGLTYTQACEMAEKIAAMLNGQAI